MDEMKKTSGRSAADLFGTDTDSQCRVEGN